jgi:hypothetical protein
MLSASIISTASTDYRSCPWERDDSGYLSTDEIVQQRETLLSVREVGIWTVVASASVYHERNLYLSVIAKEYLRRNSARFADCFIGSV